MDAQGKVLLFDSLLGIVWIVAGLTFADPAAVAGVWWFVGVAAAAAAGALALEEHGYTPEGSLQWFAIAVAGVLAVGVVTVAAVSILLEPTATVAVSALQVGLGLGVIAYRLLYGLVWPVPDARLDRAREQAV
jgi:hypothetical protein